MACSRAYTDPDFFSPAPLTCQKGVMLQMKENLAQNPLPWDTFSTVTCDLKEVCQETLLLIDVGVWTLQQAGMVAWRPGSPALDSVP